ncbi:MAG TPA: hypothetical protein VIR29_03315, partial [Anseongella sp.]
MKDSLQDFFIYLWDRKAKLGEIRHLHSYLFIAFRRFLFQRAKDIAREESLQDNLGYILPGESPSAEMTAIESEQTRSRERSVNEAIKKLPPRLQEVIFPIRFQLILHTKKRV